MQPAERLLMVWKTDTRWPKYVKMWSFWCPVKKNFPGHAPGPPSWSVEPPSKPLGVRACGWCLFPFRMAMVLPLRTAWIADILSQASLRDGERQRCWKRGSGDGQSLGDYFTARLSDLSMPLTSEVRRSPEPSARPSAAADSEERQIWTTCLFAESVGLCLCFLPSCAMYKDNAVGNVVAETGRDLVFFFIIIIFFSSNSRNHIEKC